MKKLLVVVVLTVCLGLVSGVFADQASAFLGNIFGGGKTCGYAAPYCGPTYYYGCYAPAWGCARVYKKKRAAVPAEKKAKAAPAKAKTKSK